MPSKDPDQNLVISYLTLRRLVGALGMALPIVVMVWGFTICGCTRILPSISDYYMLRTRDALVGILFSIACFLYTYRGFDDDDRYGNLAAIFAVAVALFPNSGTPVERTVHFSSAAGLLLVLAYFSLKIFTKSSGHPTPQKLIRNRVYTVCGLLILVCVLLIGLYKSFGEASELALLRPVFWLETIALWSFGFSWFVKGETLWRDK
jgi:hypothetical protein